MGIGNYSLPGYFVNRSNYYSKAWDYYRLKTEGQNSIVFNPGEAPGQGVQAKAELIITNPEQRHGVIDLSQAYSRYASFVHRGFALLDPDTVIIKDHISRIKASESPLQYNWIAHTRIKKAEYIGTDRRAVLLYGNRGTRLLVFGRYDGTHRFEFIPGEDGSPLHLAEPMTQEHRPYWPGSPEAIESGIQQNPNSNYRKLVMRMTSDKWMIGTVVFKVLKPGDPVKIPEINDERFTLEPSKWAGSSRYLSQLLS